MFPNLEVKYLGLPVQGIKKMSIEVVFDERVPLDIGTEEFIRDYNQEILDEL